mgnify:CR=1 FL=1
MNILITGATGFIGGFLIPELKEHSIRLISRNDIPGQLHHFKKELSPTENFEDCLNGVDVVIHTAARVHQMNEPLSNSLSKYMETNYLGTLNLADQAAKMGVKRFIFLSSIKVNGEKTFPERPFKYDDPRAGEDPYGKSKSEAELGLLKIACETQLEVTILRPPLVYGSGVKANFASLLKLASMNLPLPLGSIENKRSFVAIDNLLNLIITCLDHPKAANQIFLVSDDEDISTAKLYSIMTEAFGNKARLLNVKPHILKTIARVFRKEDVINRLCDNLQVDIEHTKRTLGWRPIISTKKGIELCISSINQNE